MRRSLDDIRRWFGGQHGGHTVHVRSVDTHQTITTKGSSTLNGQTFLQNGAHDGTGWSAKGKCHLGRRNGCDMDTSFASKVRTRSSSINRCRNRSFRQTFFKGRAKGSMIGNTSSGKDGTINAISLGAKGLQGGKGGTGCVKGSSHTGLRAVGSSKELFGQDDLSIRRCFLRFDIGSGQGISDIPLGIIASRCQQWYQTHGLFGSRRKAHQGRRAVRRCKGKSAIVFQIAQ
mmetsp:Transcript_29261/g.48355  ORF Transcript_29261/g.48355 Transcript_29261/m.48355 type:complete len:231 (+) Transcript_29261:363-1055(+)